MTYPYKISNLGVSNLENVVVSYDKINEVNYSSGDTNADKILQPSEAWIYTGAMNLSETTTNIVTFRRAPITLLLKLQIASQSLLCL